MKLKRLALSLAAFAAAPCHAALVQFFGTVDLSTCNGLSTQCSRFGAMPTQTIAVGDVVNFTVSFAGNQRLQLTDNDGGNEIFVGWLDGVGTPGNFSISNASITFGGLQGTWNSPFTKASETNGLVHIGPAFSGDLLATGASVSFSSYQVQFTVTALPANPNTYSSLFFVSDGMTVGLAPNVVSEPATLGLAGLAGLATALAGALSRRRRC